MKISFLKQIEGIDIFKCVSQTEGSKYLYTQNRFLSWNRLISRPLKSLETWYLRITSHFKKTESHRITQTLFQENCRLHTIIEIVYFMITKEHERADCVQTCTCYNYDMLKFVFFVMSSRFICLMNFIALPTSDENKPNTNTHLWKKATSITLA